MELNELFEIDEINKKLDNNQRLFVSSLYTDTRKIKTSGIFFCLQGEKFDGHDLIDEAISKGANVIVYEKDIIIDKYNETDGSLVLFIKVDNVLNELKRCAVLFYNNPSHKLNVIGVTGTNGKTSTTLIMKHIMNQYQISGYIGTLGIEYADIKEKGVNTTPDVLVLQQTMRDMVDKKVEYLMLEVSSHALSNDRVYQTKIKTAVFTNLTNEHLDFHGNMENYMAVKARMFENLDSDSVTILNKDDTYSYDYLINVMKKNKENEVKIITYGIREEADFRADNIKLYVNHTTFDLYYENKIYPVTTNLTAMFNVYNALAAISSLVVNGLSVEQVLAYLNNVPQINGRIENISNGLGINIIVDFAHTPDAMANVYQYAKSITNKENKIITVFGCNGRCDSPKCESMGRQANDYCDMIILTDDSPMERLGTDIIMDITKGINKPYLYEENRKKAIFMALEKAEIGDTVTILGMGHETAIMYAKHTKPYIGDKNVVLEYLRGSR